MRKFISLFLSSIIVVLVFVGCSEPSKSSDTSCDHQYACSFTKQPTYEEEGINRFTCSKCGITYVEKIAKLEKPVVPTEILDKTLSELKYRSGMFSISLGKLVNLAIDNYKIEHMSGEEAVEKGYIKQADINTNKINVTFLYYVIISGDTMINPEIPYYTAYEKEAVRVWMEFDEQNNFKQAGMTLCENLQTFAILTMSASYY